MLRTRPNGGGQKSVRTGFGNRSDAKEEVMPDKMVVYAGVYSDPAGALADLEALDRLHGDDVIGKFDAAVIEKKDGKAHIRKRMARPRVRLIPELVGAGTLPRKELEEAAQDLLSGEAGLIVVAEPTLEKKLDQAITRAAKVAKRRFDATADQLASELTEALKS